MVINFIMQKMNLALIYLQHVSIFRKLYFNVQNLYMLYINYNININIKFDFLDFSQCLLKFE